jgi:hypothetical protein
MVACIAHKSSDQPATLRVAMRAGICERCSARAKLISVHPSGGCKRLGPFVASGAKRAFNAICLHYLHQVLGSTAFRHTDLIRAILWTKSRKHTTGNRDASRLAHSTWIAVPWSTPLRNVCNTTPVLQAARRGSEGALRYSWQAASARPPVHDSLSPCILTSNAATLYFCLFNLFFRDRAAVDRCGADPCAHPGVLNDCSYS